MGACDPEQPAAVFSACPRHLAKFVDAISKTPKKLQAAAAVESPQFPHQSPDGKPLSGVVAETESAEKPLQEAINTVAAAAATSKTPIEIPPDSMLSKTADVLGMAIRKQKNMNQ